ncbi:MAG: hypothetical protein IKU24_02070, partial [Clostridia bacterium]|nr:hypothetical protein [Clostridia bacterium]
MTQKTWNICTLGSSKTIGFAASEFARLISLMDPEAAVNVSNEKKCGEKSLKIGLTTEISFPTVEDSKIDDGIYIDVQNCAGIITGANERSVLIAVYRFFREVGCVFVRPGRSGEFIPKADSASLCVKISETPAYRHRGLCLEGSNC